MSSDGSDSGDKPKPSGFFKQIGEGLYDAAAEGVKGTVQLVVETGKVLHEIATTDIGKEAAWETAKSMAKDAVALASPIAPKEWKDDLNNRLSDWGAEQLEGIKEEFGDAKENGELPKFFSKKLGWTVIAIITKKVGPKFCAKCAAASKTKPTSVPGKSIDVPGTDIKVTGVTKHAVHQKMNRGVRSADVHDALKNPLEVKPVKVDNLGRPSQRIIGKKAEVAVNPQTGKIVSINPTSSKKASRLSAKGGKK